MEWTEKIRLLDEEQQDQVLQMVEVFLAGEMPKKHTLYPIKFAYSVEDIRNIVKLFSPTKKWTCADLENEAIFPPDLKMRMQLLDYKIHILYPTTSHQFLLANVTTYFHKFLKDNRLGIVIMAPLGLYMHEGTCIEPDITVILNPKLDKITQKGLFFAPDLVVEIVSSINYKKLREAKKQKYADFGVEEYWEVYPAKKKINVEILEKTEEKASYVAFSTAQKKGKIRSKILEGFELDLGDVFV